MHGLCRGNLLQPFRFVVLHELRARHVLVRGRGERMHGLGRGNLLQPFWFVVLQMHELRARHVLVRGRGERMHGLRAGYIPVVGFRVWSKHLHRMPQRQVLAVHLGHVPELSERHNRARGQL